MTPPDKSRIVSIDILRGIAMVIMALDHVRDYFHIGANVDDPLNLATTTPLLFLTRWITHFCAPVFVFLSGTSIFLQSRRKSKNELGLFLIKRGLWLIFAEWVIVSLAWTFNPLYNVIPFQVIWAIGISMVIMGILVLLKISFKTMLTLGLIIVAGHNLLDIPESAAGFTSNFWWDLVHHGKFVRYEYAPGHFAIIVYPFLAWTGLMMLGYCAGIYFTQKYSREHRQKILIRLGTGMIAFFIALRFTNLYGNPSEWEKQQNAIYTLFSFISVEKYPPSLLYLCMTIGPALILLAFTEKLKNRFANALVVFGRTAFFYYILHLYLIHLLATMAFFIHGHTLADAANIGERFPFLFVTPGEGFGLAGVYIIWIAVVLILYPVCRMYDRYKINHKEKWWLSYL